MRNFVRFFRCNPFDEGPFAANAATETEGHNLHGAARDFATEASLVTMFGGAAGEIINLWAVEGTHFNDERAPHGRRTA